MNDDPSSESRQIAALETDQTIDNGALLTSKHHDLEDHIELLRELDKQRTYSAELRNYGIHLLEQWLKTSRATANRDFNIDHIFPGDDLAIMC